MAGSLDGIKVVDLSRVLGGPYCTQMLADHGAEVIKVEPPLGDETRSWGPPFNDELSAYFSGANRNKRSIAIDLQQPEGRDLILRFLQDADVLVHNFKSGTLEKWGLGYDDVLRARFPRLVLCHVTGFGSDGPLGGFPGYDAVVQAMTGLMSINGNPSEGPTRMGTPIVDIGTGLIACNAILAALLERGRSGLGQAIEVPLYDCAISMMPKRLIPSCPDRYQWRPAMGIQISYHTTCSKQVMANSIWLSVTMVSSQNSVTCLAYLRCPAIHDLPTMPRVLRIGQR